MNGRCSEQKTTKLQLFIKTPLFICQISLIIKLKICVYSKQLTYQMHLFCTHLQLDNSNPQMNDIVDIAIQVGRGEREGQSFVLKI